YLQYHLHFPYLHSFPTRRSSDLIQSRIEFRGETTFSIQPEDLREVAKFCRDDLSFDYLIDISSVDNFGDEPRFEVVYELYSMTLDRKSTRLNSSHLVISYAVFCL